VKIEFLGVGEAFDPALGNTSLLIHTAEKLLIDCGYAIPLAYFAKNLEPNFLDAVYLTHSHADHTFGLPALLTRIYEEGRNKPLTLIGQPGTQEMVLRILDTAYPNIRKHLSYELKFIDSADPVRFGGLDLAFAETSHSLRNFAVRVSDGKTALAVSGDGAATEASIKLYAESDLLIHESYKATELVWGHASAEQIFGFAKSLPRLRRIGLVHLQRNERRKNSKDFLAFDHNPSCEFSIPKPGEVWE
jgi:ribonuclease BN (tRNA processing enzyme)